MKHFTILFLSLLITCWSVADEWVNINSSTPSPAKINLVSSDIANSVVKIEIDGFYTKAVRTPEGDAFVLNLEESSPILEAGSPDLPKLTTSLLIPDMADMEIEVISKSYTDFEGYFIAPSKGNFTRDIDPDEVPYIYGEVYQQNQFFPENLFELRDPHIIRDYRGQTVIFYPFQYNPVTKILRVYQEMTIKVRKKNDNGINPLIRTRKLEKIDDQFSKIYSNHFLNFNNTDYISLEEQGSMLVISYGSFMTDMQAFVDWKNTIGIPTEMVNVATIGTTSSAIKTYIANYYNSHNLTFVLLVGDAAQVPSSYSGGDSDNDYSYIVGSDHDPDIFVGRFSAESSAHVQTQVQRTIDYEQNPTTGYDWYTKNIGISSSQGPGDDDEYDYTHIRNMQTDLIGYTYTSSYELFDGSQGGNDAAGNPTATMVGNDINSGASLILYTGHGSNTSWSSSGFSSTNVNSLTNNGKLPFVWSVACVNGNFVGTTCFAEAWLRATNNNEPSGAIATLMSTINQSWDPPMDGQDEMVDILTESYTNNIKRTFGGLSMNGCIKMNETYGSSGDAMTDTWTCFGDPSVVVRTAVPQTLAVTHNSVILLGSSQFTVNCNVDGALVCLSINNQIVGTAYVSGGSATVSFDPMTTIETVTIAVTAYNYIPYIGSADVVPASGPYINFSGYNINDASGNNNGEADYNENITLDVTLENAGSDPAYNVEGTLSSSDPYVSITDNTQLWGTIVDGATSTQNNAFALTIADNIPDQYTINFDLEITDGTDIWNSTFQLLVSAPLLEFGNLYIDDNTSGNGNGRLDPGETADIAIPILNNGNSNSPTASASLTSGSSWITINTGSASLGVINAAGGLDAVFNVTCDPLTPVGTTVDLSVDVDAGNFGINNTFYTPVGLILEDWETGNFGSYPWTFAGTADWIISAEDPFEGTYCAKSGVITHSQTTELLVEVYVSTTDDISFYRKVSSESSYDYLRFYIDGTQMEQWSGDVAWGQVSYPVTIGAHTFKWEYSKDGSVDGGSDCAWVDYIIFPPIVPPPDPAEIALSPMSFEVTLAPDGNTVEQLNIANIGEEDLSFTLLKSYLSDKGGSKAYCPSIGGGTDEFIGNVTIGTINNTTDQSNYADYTSISTTVNVGESYPITITNGDPNWSSDQCGIWVDWNQNEDYTDDAVITVSGTPGVGPYTANIVPPVDALGGPTRMRVQILYSATPDPCLASFSYGEVEDYTLVVNSNFADWLTLDPASGVVAGSNNMDIDLTFDATDLELGDYFANLIVNSTDPVNPQLIVPCTLHVAEGVLVNVKAILEGPFVGTEMTTSLNALGIIPKNQPYNTSPWNYNGDESVTSIPNADIVDWVLVELRETPGDITTATPATMIGQKAGFILKDGSIVSIDGSSSINFDVSVEQNIFTVVYHRNHLGIISASPIDMVGDSYVYDFSTAADKAYGGILAHKEIAPGVWAMPAGDGLCDGEVDNKDKNDIWKVQNNTNGYFSGDMNLDGFVDMSDKSMFWKVNSGKCSHVIK